VTAAPSPLAFTAVYKGPAPAAQTVSVNAVNGTVAFTATTDQPWLTAQAAGGATPSQVTVNAAPGSMVPGIYTGNVTLTSGVFAFTIPVTFKILPLALSVNPQALQFASASCGSGTVTQTLQVVSNGAPDTYNIASNVPWLTVSPSQGDTGATPFVTVTFDPGKVPSGTTPSGGVLTVSSAGEAPISVAVTVNYVSGNSLIFSAGALNFQTVSGSTPPAQNITASAACSNVPVQIYADSAWISVNQASGMTPSQATVSVNTNNMAPGTYTGHVMAYSFGAVSTPAQATVTLVIQAP
jgi:hypothetical protein